MKRFLWLTLVIVIGLSIFFYESSLSLNSSDSLEEMSDSGKVAFAGEKSQSLSFILDSDSIKRTRVIELFANAPEPFPGDTIYLVDAQNISIIGEVNFDTLCVKYDLYPIDENDGWYILDLLGFPKDSDSMLFHINLVSDGKVNYHAISSGNGMEVVVKFFEEIERMYSQNWHDRVTISLLASKIEVTEDFYDWFYMDSMRVSCNFFYKGEGVYDLTLESKAGDSVLFNIYLNSGGDVEFEGIEKNLGMSFLVKYFYKKQEIGHDIRDFYLRMIRLLIVAIIAASIITTLLWRNNKNPIVMRRIFWIGILLATIAMFCAYFINF